MGEVYEAETDGGKRVALKLYAVDRGEVAFLRRRFLCEGRLLAHLSHPNIVHVHAVGVDTQEGTPYLVMDLVLDKKGRSRTLADIQKAGEVTEAKAETWYGQLVAALHCCHAHKIVHRDVKLNNVLLDAEGNAVLSDFGVARVFDPELRAELQVATTFIEGETTGTRPVMGTYWYLAPEIRKGRPATPASDWYALGVLFFRLLTGMWYEPGTQALELLAPYDRRWRERLEKLLSDDPAARIPADADHPVDTTSSSRPSRRTFYTVLGFLVLSIVVSLVLFRFAAMRGTRSVASAVPRRSFVFDSTNRFDFCACPCGTNVYREVVVTVTRPYWLGLTPVTRRQWFAVRGEPRAAWEGGEDAPMTYVSRDEVTDFCARLNARFAARLPPGYEIRLPTMAEWRLAYAQGRTVPGKFPDKEAMRIAYAERGWFGQGVNGEAKTSNMWTYYAGLNRPVPLVTNIWTAFPPRVINPGKDNWERELSQIPPVPVGLKPANALGLHDMLGNCFERTFDTCSDAAHSWGKTEWAVTTHNLYAGLGLSVTNPVNRSGDYPLMLGSYLALDLAGDRVWSAPFDRLPHLGFRLCLGPALSTNHPTPSTQH